jgi:hypothetical protein
MREKKERVKSHRGSESQTLNSDSCRCQLPFTSHLSRLTSHRRRPADPFLPIADTPTRRFADTSLRVLLSDLSLSCFARSCKLLALRSEIVIVLELVLVLGLFIIDARPAVSPIRFSRSPTRRSALWATRFPGSPTRRHADTPTRSSRSPIRFSRSPIRRHADPPTHFSWPGYGYRRIARAD